MDRLISNKRDMNWQVVGSTMWPRSLTPPMIWPSKLWSISEMDWSSSFGTLVGTVNGGIRNKQSYISSKSGVIVDYCVVKVTWFYLRLYLHMHAYHYRLNSFMLFIHSVQWGTSFAQWRPPFCRDHVQYCQEQFMQNQLHTQRPNCQHR